MFKVSVIVPVYNAANFLAKAVDSILIQPEVGEIVLIEDQSKDNSYQIAKQLSEQHAIIKLITHPNHVNRGASASRELGIEMASFPFVAFLDADDYYLPNRFNFEPQIFEVHSDADGVYGATGFAYYSEDGKERYAKYNSTGLTTVDRAVPPDELFYVLSGISKKANGYFHLNALTIKKAAVAPNRAGNFNPNMGLHEDTEWIFRLSLKTKLYPGSIDHAIAMRGVHNDNRIVKNQAEYVTKHIMYKTVYTWAKANNLTPEQTSIVRLNMLAVKLFLVNYICALTIIICLFINYFKLVRNRTYIRRILERLFGENTFRYFFSVYKQKTL
jgi:glycosyltransferase involved in cell wall biosynthesis